MAKGLALARSFYLSGHRVIGADFDTFTSPCSGRYSRSISAFYRLPNPGGRRGAEAYVERLVDIIKAEDVKLWVSCSGVSTMIEDARAKESIEQQTPCKCIQFDIGTTSKLHEKGSFMEECRKLALPIPETHEVKSQRDVLRFLSASTAANPGRQFILKPVGIDDINRGNMTLLPLSSEGETQRYVSRLLEIADSSPWILQQFIPGGEEYCTHALVVRGEIKCFVACPSTEMLMHYESLPRNSALWESMFDFTAEFVRRSPGLETMTGHLSFDFMSTERVTNNNRIKKDIYAIECNPRAHTAVVLFAQRGLEMDDMVDAYISALGVNSGDKRVDSINETGSSTTTKETLITPPENLKSRYWMAHDLISLFIYPMLLWCYGLVHLSHVISSINEFALHIFTWQEGTFEAWDPLPAFVLYNIYWPMSVLSAWWHGRRWSRLNVSTTKMFAC
ncbi:hypothetical protein F5Y13DRAFT_186715 [Hypoxylon sp. FL1857]|nr:hypothetical protein F5Y13DRAFT_186715 [Hypoxylon sp. FL1857]